MATTGRRVSRSHAGRRTARGDHTTESAKPNPHRARREGPRPAGAPVSGRGAGAPSGASASRMHTMYSVELKGPNEEVRVLHVNPFGEVMPFGGPWRRGA